MPGLEPRPFVKGGDTAHGVAVNVREAVDVRDRVGALPWASEVVTILEARV
jgi:hypothetical protein